MKTIKLIFIIAFITVYSTFNVNSFGREDLTAEQLILLMRASSEQYKSISSRINGTGYQVPTNIKFTQQIISRWTREKEFIKIVEGSNYDSNTEKTISSINITNTDTYSISPIWSKRLMEVSGSRTVKGLISSTTGMKSSLPCYTLYTAMWELAGYPWQFIQLDSAEISYNEKDGLYILKAKITDYHKGPQIRLFVDPSKGYIPVKQENLTYEGVCFSVYECNDLRRCGDELWIPYKYSSTADQSSHSISYKVEDVVVNEPIEESLLDFEFPEGTIVTDERIGAKYRVTKSPGSETSAITKPVIQDSTEPNSKIKLPTPAADEQLRSAAEKAWVLAAAGSAKDKQPLKVEVFPQYVYVKPDKSQYPLIIRTSKDTKPQFQDFSFESDKMKLTSVENNISEKSQLIVNIQRLQGDKGFQKAVLSLRFADEKIDIIFVSPPIESLD